MCGLKVSRGHVDELYLALHKTLPLRAPIQTSHPISAPFKSQKPRHQKPCPPTRIKRTTVPRKSSQGTAQNLRNRADDSIGKGITLTIKRLLGGLNGSSDGTKRGLKISTQARERAPKSAGASGLPTGQNPTRKVRLREAKGRMKSRKLFMRSPSFPQRQPWTFSLQFYGSLLS